MALSVTRSLLHVPGGHISVGESCLSFWPSLRSNEVPVLPLAMVVQGLRRRMVAAEVLD